MRKSKSFVLLIMAVLCLCSCRNNDENGHAQRGNIGISSHVSTATMAQINSHLSYMFCRLTRSSHNITEKEAEDILSPLVPAGNQIKNDLLSLAMHNEILMTDKEINAIASLDDASLAGLAYTVATLESVLDDSLDEPIGKEHKYTKEEVLDCLFQGLVGAGGIGGTADYIWYTNKLMTATTVKEIAWAFFKRTLGWIGVVYAVYEFTDCLNEKARNK